MPVPLVEPPVADLRPDRSRRRRLELRSPVDARHHAVDLYLPRDARGPLPLVVALHPIGWTAREDYHGGLKGLKRRHHRGWRGLADAHGVIVAMPEGHPRRVALNSLASPEHIADIGALLDELPAHGVDVDAARVYACGLSMGGMEALVAAGRFPDRFAAVAAFNPIVDLAAWQKDLARTDVAELRAFGTAERIAMEVGGLPNEQPAAYAERSAGTYVDGLAQVPVVLWWSEVDLVVPRQQTHHAYALYRALKRRGPSTPATEQVHTRTHGVVGELTPEVRWQLHEWCDYELALCWLLNHRKEPTHDRPA